MATTTTSDSNEGPAKPTARRASRAKSSATQHEKSDRPSNGANGNGHDHAFGTGAMVGAAAAGLIAGLAATIGRKAAVQAVSAFSGDWFDSIKAEHQAARKIFDKLEATENSQTAKRGLLLMQLKHALAKHAFEEENVLYPSLRDHGDPDQADHLNHEHGYVKQYLFDLEHMPRNNRAWTDKIVEFRAELEKHMREEEESIFPSLHEKLGPKGNGELSAAFNREGFKLA